MPELNELLDLSIEYDQFQEKIESFASDHGGSVFESSSVIEEPFTLKELSDLIRNLNLSKEAAEISTQR